MWCFLVLSALKQLLFLIYCFYAWVPVQSQKEASLWGKAPAPWPAVTIEGKNNPKMQFSEKDSH